MKVRRGAKWGAAVATTALGAVALIVGPTLGPSGSAGAVEDTYQCNLESTGPTQFTVPAGVTSVTIQAFGAQGGSSDSFGGPIPGGEGGSVQATMPVAAGDVLSVLVGCTGSAPVENDSVGAAAVLQPGGGGAAGIAGGASGGGASVVMLNGTAASNVVVVAGGGGGAGSGGAGGAGSGNEPAERGGDGTGGVTAGEGGGTAGCANSDGGAGQGSEDGGPCASFPAAGGAGGGTSGNTFGGGGGGGGWQGGGGGGGGCGDCGDEGAGGGGGSGIVRAPAVEVPTVVSTASATNIEQGGFRAAAVGGNTGSGRVVVTYTVGPVALNVSPRFTG